MSAAKPIIAILHPRRKIVEARDTSRCRFDADADGVHGMAVMGFAALNPSYIPGEGGRMSDSNNHRVAELPLTPHPEMKRLEHLLGTWKNEGGAPGTSTYKMGLGGHYLIQEFETATPRGRKLSGIEYVTWDEDTQSLRSHLMADDGSNFTYTYQVDDDGTCWTWFGDKGSDNFFKGRLSGDGRTIVGRWQWPGGGFDVVSRRTDDR